MKYDRSLPSLPTRSLPGVLAGVLIVTLGAASAVAQGAGQPGPLGLEDLLHTEVTTASRHAQRLSDVAASVTVLTSEDLLRSGATTVPDALRLVPGLHVGQIDSNTWSVSVRGFGGRFSNKLLVLVDGRSVYTPLFGGVLWSLVNLPMEQIERIEVIRGPGATVWGANAVNGVINIITRSSAASTGTRLTLTGGTGDRAIGSASYGTQLTPTLSMRGDVGLFHRNGQLDRDPDTNANETDTGRAGLRADWRPDSAHEVTVQAGVARSRAAQVYALVEPRAPYQVLTPGDVSHSSGFLSFAWTRRDATRTTTVRANGEHAILDEPVLIDRRTMLELDAHHSQRVSPRHRLDFGASYARAADATTGTPTVHLDPSGRTVHLWSGYVQDEATLAGGRLVATLGAKLEHNDDTGWEVQPNARGIVFLPFGQSVWASVARAVRLPSRAETNGGIRTTALPPDAGSPLPRVLELTAGPEGADAERLVAWEAGYRLQPSPVFSVDASAYLDRYSDLLSVSGTPGLPRARLEGASPYLLVPIYFGNAQRLTTVGGELTAEWRPTARLRLTGGYSHFRIRHPPAVVDLYPQDYPAHQVHLRGSASVGSRGDVDVAVRYVSALAGSAVPSFVTADGRLGVLLGPLEVSLIGENLLAPRHREYVPTVVDASAADVRRAASVRLRWTF